MTQPMSERELIERAEAFASECFNRDNSSMSGARVDAYETGHMVSDLVAEIRRLQGESHSMAVVAKEELAAALKAQWVAEAERDTLYEALRDLIGEPSRMLTRPRSDSEEIPIQWGKIRKARAAVAAADEES
jgi:hypothetical protein